MDLLLWHFGNPTVWHGSHGPSVGPLVTGTGVTPMLGLIAPLFLSLIPNLTSYSSPKDGPIKYQAAFFFLLGIAFELCSGLVGS